MFYPVLSQLQEGVHVSATSMSSIHSMVPTVQVRERAIVRTILCVCECVCIAVQQSHISIIDQKTLLAIPLFFCINSKI